MLIDLPLLPFQFLVSCGCELVDFIHILGRRCLVVFLVSMDGRCMAIPGILSSWSRAMLSPWTFASHLD